jgi:hypothetical protein
MQTAKGVKWIDSNGIERDLETELGGKADKVHIYGVRIDTQNDNPETAAEYTDDAARFTPSRGNYSQYITGDLDRCFPWNAIKPCILQYGAMVGYLDPNDFTQFEDGMPADITSVSDGDVMIEIPHFWYKFGRVGDFVEVKVSTAMLPGYTDFAFSYNGEVKDKFYIGAYLGYLDGGGKLRSVSGATPTATKTIWQFRAAARVNGVGYEQLSFNKLTALQVLYLIQFKSLDSQSALGLGWTYSTAPHVTGTTDKKGMNYGCMGIDPLKFNGIEDFWGNLYQLVDGFYYSVSAGIGIADGNYNDTGNGYIYYTNAIGTTGYIADIVGTNALGFTPLHNYGSSSTHYCDFGGFYLSTNVCVLTFGGNWSAGTGAGAFMMESSNNTSSAYTSIGARLVYCG